MSPPPPGVAGNGSPPAFTPQTVSSAKDLCGYYVETPYGWGICLKDDPDNSHVQVGLNWRLGNHRRARCSIRRELITSTSFCRLGDCVLTASGAGVVIIFHPKDCIHVVQYIDSEDAAPRREELEPSALLKVLPAAPGLEVQTSYGKGTCESYRQEDGMFMVKFKWGSGILAPTALECHMARVQPLIECFAQSAKRALDSYSGSLDDIQKALKSCGFENLQSYLTSNAGEAFEKAKKMWNDFNAVVDEKGAVATAESSMEELRLRATEVIGDEQMKSTLQLMQARLNSLACTEAGFTGEWVGAEDVAPRAVISGSSLTWHWGDVSHLEVCGLTITTELDGDKFVGTLESTNRLSWSDGDIWTRKSSLQDSAADSAESTEQKAKEYASGMLQQGIGQLKQILAGEHGENEGSIEESLEVLKKVAFQDAEVQKIVDQIEARREKLLVVREKLLQTKTGQKLADSSERMMEKVQSLQESANEMAPQLEKLQLRGQLFINRLTADEKVKEKAHQLFTGAQSRIQNKMEGDEYKGAMETWALSVRERIGDRLREQQTRLVERLGGLDLEQLDVQQLAMNSWDPQMMQRQLERSLARAVQFSGENLSGTELLDRFESTEGSVSHVPVVKQTAKEILSGLDDLQLGIPDPIRKALEAQALGEKADFTKVAMETLEDDSVADGAAAMMAKGEEVLTRLQKLQNSSTLSKTFQRLEGEDIEGHLLAVIAQIDTEKLLEASENAMTSSEAREALVNHLKDVCLEFILKVLPVLSIPEVSGSDKGCDWQINDINFSDFKFRKENVQITLGDLSLNDDSELLRVSAWDIEAQFKRLKVKVTQSYFPYLSTTAYADAKASQMAITQGFKFKQNEDGSEVPELVLSSRSVEMQSLELWFEKTSYAVKGADVLATIINTLTYLFADVLKVHACDKVKGMLDKHTETLATSLNGFLQTCAPLLKRLGWSPKAAQHKADFLGTDDVPKVWIRMKNEEFIDMLDPGRACAVRV
eukprot:gnl/MRDRNA2_/MRDRNA2_76707_c0_seq1.p1 gnl/MRDRNA2_/MRDRNA2_76707_c0~~gnl/MRDRNA2_/MRDRNA2_76707_c0_seq1.p1  ORF type:complete len:1003 (+),score=246.79 gnl/MRDRNA2_/MRDRNA2_76707_c0_seq1:27-3011(+)